MTANIEKAFSLAPLDSYSFKEKIVIHAADIFFYSLVNILGRTMKFDITGDRHLDSVADAKKLPIYTFWHDRIVASTYFFRHRGIVVITSKSLDGEYIARFIIRMGYGSVRGSSSRGGVAALVEMIRLMKLGRPAGFTIDGPRGPRHEAKKGAVLLAKKTGNPVLPFVVEPLRYWTVKSWDRLHIPKPFTRAMVFIGEPIYVPRDADDETIEQHRLELQSSLDALVRTAAGWRAANGAR